ncbi:MAG: hypothetical protein HC848_04095 [Limnobacter sp.]|nr:hypothetical protein [Limnobacter sp.]
MSETALLSELTALELADFHINQKPLLKFRELLGFLFDNRLQANVELKAENPKRAMALGRSVQLVLNSLTPDEQQEVQKTWVFSSFFHASLIALDGYRRALLYEVLEPGWQRRALALQAEAVHLGLQGLTVQAVHSVLEHGLQVRVYTVNDASQALQLQGLGVHAIFTDHLRIGLDIAERVGLDIESIGLNANPTPAHVQNP